MIRKIGLILFCLSGFWATTAVAITTHSLQKGASTEYVLPVNEPQTYTNIFVWPIIAYCTIISEEANNSIAFKMLSKSGAVSGIELSEGDSLQLTVHPKQKLNIFVVSGAKVEVTNVGEQPFKISCLVI